MYFETGQGSALVASAHHGVDQQTLEARAYAVARRYQPLLVNTVVGFIGPEYLYDGKQITRAGLEDHFCGKLLGLPMGCDVCYTNHAEADQDDMDALLTLLAVAGVNFVMGVPGADDIMLGYQSTSFHDALAMRELLARRPAPEFEAWLAPQGLLDAAGRIRPRTPAAALQARLAWRERRPRLAGGCAASPPPASACPAPAPRSPPRRCSTSAWPMPAPATPCTPRWTTRAARRPAGAALVVSSAAPDRATYLRRPDLGRSLDPAAARPACPARRVLRPRHRAGGRPVRPGRAAPRAASARTAAPRPAGLAVAPLRHRAQARVALGDASPTRSAPAPCSC